jgi:hypothetical protein
MFQDLNDILIVFYERTEVKNNQYNNHNNHNSTKRVYLNNIHNKHSKTFKKQYKDLL